MLLVRGLRLFPFLAALAMGGCRGGLTHADRVVAVQPLGDIPSREVAAVCAGLRSYHRRVVLRPALPLPSYATYPSRARHRADRLISWLREGATRDTVILGLTAADISTTKKSLRDWGVMGLGYTPGSACVASGFRLSRTRRAEQLFKVAIHELGHTQGLPHCPVDTCFMRDAEGRNPLDAEKSFCRDCAAFLRGKGWQLRSFRLPPLPRPDF